MAKRNHRSPSPLSPIAGGQLSSLCCVEPAVPGVQALPGCGQELLDSGQICVLCTACCLRHGCSIRCRWMDYTGLARQSTRRKALYEARQAA
jgi:hypothetical protein